MNKFCPFCGSEVKFGAKFCGSCGKSLPASEKNNEPARTQFTGANQNTQFGGQVPPLSGTKQGETISDKAKGLVEGIKAGDSQQKKRLIQLAGAVVILLVIIFGVSWVKNGDYRQAMKTADGYFTQGKYGEAEKFYKKAYEFKPQDEKAQTYGSYSKELGEYWTEINSSDYPEDTGSLGAYKNLKQSAETVKDKDVKAAYEQTLAAIKNSDDYKLAKEISDRLSKEGYD